LRKGSRRWKRVQRRKQRFLAQQQKRTRAIEHKVSRAVVDLAGERQAGTLAVGGARDVADGKRWAAKSQQQLGLWSHGTLRHSLTYKAEAIGMALVLVDEHDTMKTCPGCGRQYKSRGRVYRHPNPVCGVVAHRDGLGAVNLLSRQVRGELAKIVPPPLGATR